MNLYLVEGHTQYKTDAACHVSLPQLASTPEEAVKDVQDRYRPSGDYRFKLTARLRPE